jgi:hypothetical protein
VVGNLPAGIRDEIDGCILQDSLLRAVRLIVEVGHWGVGPGIAHDLVDEAIGRRFHGWTGPGIALVDDVAGRLAARGRRTSKRDCPPSRPSTTWNGGLPYARPWSGTRSPAAAEKDR